MATYIDVSPEEEQVSSIVQHIDSLKKKKDGNNATEPSESPFVADCNRLYQEGKLSEVILKVINELDVVFEQNDKDVEPINSVIASLIKKLDPTQRLDVINRWREVIAASPTDRPLLRLKLLGNIYHTFESNSIERYHTFLLIAKVAHESNNAELIIPKFKQAEKWLSDWGTTREQKSTFYKYLHKMLKHINRSAHAHKILVKYLQEYNDVEINLEDAEVISSAVEAALEAISLEDQFQIDHLFGLKAIHKLEHHPQHAPLYRLLQIFAQEKLEALKEFNSKYPFALQNLGLQEEQCVRKLRLLSLASLASEMPEIPYSEIGSTLQIRDEDIESWVITAVSSKLIEAKLDQLRKVAVVSFTVQRVFTNNQWKQLSTRLDKWKNSIQQLLQVVQQTKHTAAHHIQNFNPSSSSGQSTVSLNQA